MRTRRLVGILAIGALLGACGGGSNGNGPSGRSTEATGTSGSATVVDRPESRGRVKIVSPRNGVVVHATSVELRIRLEGAKIVPQTTTEISPDEGHLHVILDDTLVSMTEGTEQTLTELTPGTHRLQVEFVAADHAPFDPRVVAIVAFEVQP